MRQPTPRFLLAPVVIAAAVCCQRVPEDFGYVAGFVAVLQSEGVRVNGIGRWSHIPVSIDAHQAATISTDHGYVQIVVFDDPVTAARVKLFDKSEAEQAP